MIPLRCIAALCGAMGLVWFFLYYLPGRGY